MRVQEKPCLRVWGSLLSAFLLAGCLHLHASDVCSRVVMVTPTVDVARPPEPVGGPGTIAVRYPDACKAVGTEGLVTLDFRVDEAGRARNVHVAQGIGDACDHAAAEAIEAALFTVPLDSSGQAIPTPMEAQVQFGLTGCPVPAEDQPAAGPAPPPYAP
ncbi:MAG TPA: TonB family protein [Rhodothermales bacterium]|nr:TonB family protein [Rhodothermales bacterium]